MLLGVRRLNSSKLVCKYIPQGRHIWHHWHGIISQFSKSSAIDILLSLLGRDLTSLFRAFLPRRWLDENNALRATVPKWGCAMAAAWGTPSATAWSLSEVPETSASGVSAAICLWELEWDEEPCCLEGGDEPLLAILLTCRCSWHEIILIINICIYTAEKGGLMSHKGLELGWTANVRWEGRIQRYALRP